jgi:hypothetical protein
MGHVPSAEEFETTFDTRSIAQVLLVESYRAPALGNVTVAKKISDYLPGAVGTVVIYNQQFTHTFRKKWAYFSKSCVQSRLHVKRGENDTDFHSRQK